jgi:hypothetical protein
MNSLKNTADLKTYILSRHPFLDSRKFDCIKSGSANFVYYVDLQGMLQKTKVFSGSLPTVESVAALQTELNRRIDEFVARWQHC